MSNLNQSQIIQDNSGDYRVYHIPSLNKKYASVNSIISAIEPKDSLRKWQHSVGFEKAEFIRNEAAFRGNTFHHCSEKYLKKLPIPSVDQSMQLLFNKVVPLLDAFRPVFIEDKTYWVDNKDDRLGFAGTPDLVASIDGAKLFSKTANKLFEGEANLIIDWKTWNKAKYPCSKNRNGDFYFPLIRYCLQLSAYSAALNQRTNLLYGINKALIVGVTADYIKPVMYFLSHEAIFFYWTKFKEIMQAFYNGSYFDWKQMESEALHNNYLGERVYLA